MKHRVEGATILCIDTSRRFPDGGTYIVAPGQTATVRMTGTPDRQVVAGERPKTFKVTHSGSLEVR